MRLRDRDPAALATFFDYYFPKIFALAQRMMGDPAQAEDVTQEVFLKVHRALHRIDPERDPEPWLRTIVCNACREYWRGKHHRASRRSVSLQEIPDWEARHPRSTGTPESAAIQSESHDALRRALRALPESLREVVVLFDYAGLSHKEIALALGASHAAVRKRYSRALAALSNMLRDRE